MQTLQPLRIPSVLLSCFKSSSVQTCLSQCLPTFSRRFLSKKEARRLSAQRHANDSRIIAETSRRLLRPAKKDASTNDNNIDHNHNLDDATVIGPVQNFRHFLVMDLEATCDHKSQGPFGPQEIIEFPALKVCSRTFRVEAQFHTFVRPTVNPILKPFCTQLTGVVQDDVDRAPTLVETLAQFRAWMVDERLVEDSGEAVSNAGNRPSSNFAVVTCGDWDLAQMLPEECARLGVDLPPYLTSWINVKTSFADSHGKWARGMQHMLDELKLPLHGRPHSGIDDCVNIRNILAAIAAKKQFVYRVTSTLKGARTSGDVANNLRSFAD